MVTRARPRLAACAAVVVSLLWIGAHARDAAAQEANASGVDKARGELGELRYDDALATLSKALKAGTSGPAATAQIYLMMGEVRASLGQRDAAEKAFQLALAIDPAVELRKGVSPKISRPFRRARRARRGGRRLEIEHQVASQNPPTVAIIVQSDPLGMLAGARITYWTEGGAARSMAGPGAGRIEIELPRGASRFTVAGIDEHGNRLVELGSDQQPLAFETGAGGKPAPAQGPAVAAAASGAASEEAASPVETASAEPEAVQSVERQSGDGESDRSTPIYASWLLWGGVAIGIGAAGTWAGLTAQSAVNDLDDIRESDYEYEFSQAQEVADRAEQRSLIANICFAAAGASAIASAILFVRQHGDSEESEDGAALAPMVGEGQLGVAASLRF